MLRFEHQENQLKTSSRNFDSEVPLDIQIRVPNYFGLATSMALDQLHMLQFIGVV